MRPTAARPFPARLRAALLALAVLAAAACGGGGGSGDGGQGSADLAALPVERMDVGGVTFEVWIADEDAERRRGLMFASEEQLAPLDDGTPRGMLFVYAADAQPGFWMRDTVVPLDLAYATADGRIVETHALEPLDEMRVFAGQPIRFALEARRGTFATHGIGIGDRIAVPD